MALVAHWVYTCDSGTRGAATPLGAPAGSQMPYCNPGVAGSWQHVYVRDNANEFDLDSLNLPQLGEAYAAGFVVMATGLVIIGAAKMVLRAFKHHF